MAYQIMPQTAYGAVVDIAKLPSDNKIGIKLPAGFVATGCAVKELVKANGTAATITVSVNSNTLGAAVDIGRTNPVQVFNAGTARTVTAASDVVVTLGGTSAATTGVLDIRVIGFYPFDGDLVANTVNNKASADPMYA